MGTVTLHGGARMAEPLKKALGRQAVPMANYLDLHTIGDLLRHYPRRYVEPTTLAELSKLPEGELVTFVAEVMDTKLRPMRSGRATMCTVTVADEDGRAELTFFQRTRYHKDRFIPGSTVLVTGRLSSYRGLRQLAHPAYEVLDQSSKGGGPALAPVPIYPAAPTHKVSSEAISRSVRVLLDTLDELADPLPAELRARLGLIGLRQALVQVHRPADIAEVAQARRRLRFEEAFVLQVALAQRRAVLAGLPATARPPTAGGLLAEFDRRLPFELTAGQRAVGEQLTADLAREFPMHRLLQGEVGSGKTVVALRAMLAVVDAGGQAALLAPTEVLAAQHHRSITALLGDLAAAGMLGGDERGTRVALLTGSMSAPARRSTLLDVASGAAGIVVGTHALLQQKVQFADLGLVVVDEQHRFGVEQRDALRDKGKTVPHLLVMTATPIPRTVAMTVFGDLEVSTLAELPAGRQPISTHIVHAGSHPQWVARAWQRLREEVDAGHQAYVVCPRIGDDEGNEDWNDDQGDADRTPAGGARPDATDPDAFLGFDFGDAPEAEQRPARAVLDVLAELRSTEALGLLRIEPLHGRMPPADREATMAGFAAGEVDVLVATTVVEVGVDVPNATAMVIMDADRFGVSQLHQLRGRVGRGRAPGLCLLVTESGAEPAEERLAAVQRSVDGFELARVDLEQRREGDVLGAAQSGGQSSLRLLRVLRDADMIEQARREAVPLVAGDPELAGQPALVAAIGDWLGAERGEYLDRG